MSRSRWLVTAVAMVLGVALASLALAADPNPLKDPQLLKPKEPLVPKVIQTEVPGFPPYDGSSGGVFNLIKGQSYTVKVKYSTPALPGFRSYHPQVGPYSGWIAVASKGVVVVQGGAYIGSVYEFFQTYCLSIPPVKPGESKVLETPVFLVPANLTGGAQFNITTKKPAQSCR